MNRLISKVAQPTSWATLLSERKIHMTTIALVLILIISVITDLRNRKILNIITLPAILIALIYHSFTSGLGGFYLVVKDF